MFSKLRLGNIIIRRLIVTSQINVQFLSFVYNMYQLLCSPNEVGEHIGFTLFLIVLLLLSSRFLSANVLRNYWRDQHETFQDDSLAFVDVRNEGNFLGKCMHALAHAFEFLHIKTCKTNISILCSNLIKFTWQIDIEVPN